MPASQDEALKRLEPFKLDGVVQKITCPFLMLHGEGDEQIPLPRRRSASTPSARNKRHSRSSPATKAAITTARSTTRASARLICGTGSKRCWSRRAVHDPEK